TDPETGDLIAGAESMKKQERIGGNVGYALSGLTRAVGKIRNIQSAGCRERASEKPACTAVRIELDTRRCSDGTNIIKSSAALGEGRNGLIVRSRLAFMAPFFGNKEKSFVFFCVEDARNVERAAKGEAAIVFAIERSASRLIEEVASVEDFVANEKISVSMKRSVAGFYGGDGDAGSAPAPLSTIIRSKNLQGCESVKARIDKQSAVA